MQPASFPPSLPPFQPLGGLSLDPRPPPPGGCQRHEADARRRGSSLGIGLGRPNRTPARRGRGAMDVMSLGGQGGGLGGGGFVPGRPRGDSSRTKPSSSCCCPRARRRGAAVPAQPWPLRLRAPAAAARSHIPGEAGGAGHRATAGAATTTTATTALPGGARHGGLRGWAGGGERGFGSCG